MEVTRQEVKKLSLKDDNLEVVFEADFAGINEDGNPVEETAEYSRKSSQMKTADFKEAIHRLCVHMVCICEMPEAAQITEANVYDFDTEQLANYEVTGYTLSGSDDSAGASLLGKKMLESGMVLNLNVPFTKFEDESVYKHGSSLMADIEACNAEAELFIKGKWGVVQQEIPGFELDAPNEAQETGATMEVVRESPKLEEAV